MKNIKAIDEGMLTVLNPVYKENPRTVIEQHTESVYQITGRDTYLFTQPDTVKKILSNKDFSVNPGLGSSNTRMSDFSEEGEERSMLFQDNPTHKRLRSTVARYFNPKNIAALAPVIERRAHELCDEIEHLTDPFDVITTFCEPLPTFIIAEMLGVEVAKQPWFSEVSKLSVNAFFRSDLTEQEIQTATEKNDELSAYLEARVDLAQQQVSNDIISSMVNDANESEIMTKTEIVTQARLLLIAGNVTTSDLLGNAVKTLLNHPLQLEKLRNDLDLCENAIEEVLRFDPPVTNSGRIAVDDGEIQGCPFKKGDSLSTHLLAANLNEDPQPNEKPMYEFDISRNNIKHYSFGGGIHFCIGAPLARLEASIGLRVFCTRFKQFKLHDQGYSFRNVPGFNGVEKLFLTK